MKENLTIKDIGLEVIKWPITKVRVGKVDDRWLVEYRRKAKWVLDRWWWFDDGKYINLGALRGNIGSQNYSIPSEINLYDYSSISIWCERFSVSFGAAALRTP